MAPTEIATSILLTYAGSEWLHGSRRRAIVSGGAAAALQLLVRVLALGLSGSARALSAAAGLRIPPLLKAPLIAAIFIGTLWLDTVGRGRLSRADFAAELQSATLRMLPLCPLLSLLVAAALLGVGEAFEHLGLPTEWLDLPIYYGVFYGPFVYTYLLVKAAAARATLLPTSIAGGRR